MRRAVAMIGSIPGAMKRRARSTWTCAGRNARRWPSATSGRTGSRCTTAMTAGRPRHRWVATPLVPAGSASSTWPATCGSGPTTGTGRTLAWHRPIRRGLRRARAASRVVPSGRAEAPTRRAQRTATGSIRTRGTAPSASAVRKTTDGESRSAKIYLQRITTWRRSDDQADIDVIFVFPATPSIGEVRADPGPHVRARQLTRSQHIRIRAMSKASSSPGLALVFSAFAVSACATASDGPSAADWLNAPAPRASAASTFTKTRYPIVLAHGLGGFRQLFGVVDYFFEIPDGLRSGGAQVFVTQVSATGSAEDRGEQLLQQIEFIAASTGAGKVNLIGHSQGGLDARYVMAVRPDLVASLTTVATPHLGADLADFLADNVTPGGFNETVLAAFGNSLGTVIDLLTGTPEPQDAIGALHSLSSAGATEFNHQFPAGLAATRCGATPTSFNGIQLYSWAGSSVLTNILD